MKLCRMSSYLFLFIIRIKSEKATAIPTVNAVAKTRKTAQQKTLGKKERESNLDNCFTVTEPTKLNGKHILIIDDVTTTGATLTEMYKTINNCEGCLCTAIDFAVFART